MYNSPHQSDESVNLNQSRYSAPPSTSRFDPTKPPTANHFFHNHPLSLLNTAASLPHLNDICPPSGPMSLNSALLSSSVTAGTSDTSSPSAAATSAFLKTAGRHSSDLGNFMPHSQALSKHWIWNSSFFYPSSRHHLPPAVNINTATASTASSVSHSAEGFQPYLSGAFAPTYAKSPSSPISAAVVIDLPIGGPHTNTTTTSGSDLTSEDSFDPDDAKNPYRTPPPSPSGSAEHQQHHNSHHQQQSQNYHHHHTHHQHNHHQHQHEPSSSFVELKKKARNPYSIEELLKKPEPKRQRLMEAASQSPSAATTATGTSFGSVAAALPQAVTFHPSIVIDDRSRSTLDSPESPTVVIDSSSHSDEDELLKNEAIEICD